MDTARRWRSRSAHAFCLLRMCLVVLAFALPVFGTAFVLVHQIQSSIGGAQRERPAGHRIQAATCSGYRRSSTS